MKKGYLFACSQGGEYTTGTQLVAERKVIVKRTGMGTSKHKTPHWPERLRYPTMSLVLLSMAINLLCGVSAVCGAEIQIPRREIDFHRDWSISGPFDPEGNGKTDKRAWRGVGWYRRTFSPNPADAGSAHGMEVAYVFQHLNPSDPRTTKSDLEISEAMATYWTHSARHGDPNGAGVPPWPAFSDESPGLMIFGQRPHTGTVPGLAALRVLDEYLTWRRTAEGEAWAE